MSHLGLATPLNRGSVATDKAETYGMPSGLRPGSDKRLLAKYQMPPLTEYFLWYVPDERTGKLQLTKYKLTRADAERAFPGAVPDLSSREVRDLPEIGKAPANRRPGEN
jgi:hypothetical protein